MSLPAKRFLVPLISWGLVAGLYLGGGLEFFELKLLEIRFRLIERPATSEMVLVGIDPKSLREIGVWPWPRSLHGVLVERLLAAGATRVALDIDFSSPSFETEDARFEAALRTAGKRVILPVFVQRPDYGASGRRLESTGPLPRFRRHAALASVNIRPDRDGIVRRTSLAEPWRGTMVATLPALLSGASRIAPRGQPPPRQYIDYGIQVESIPQISYADVLRGTFDPALVAGRPAIVGATALELGDHVPVPVWNALPGPLVQALAYQSIMQDRALRRLPPAVIVAGALALSLLLAPVFTRWPWSWGLALSLGSSAAVFAGAAAAQAAWPVIIDAVPMVLTTLLGYAAALVHRIDRQNIRLLTQRLALRRQDILMKRVVENTFDGIVTIGEDGRVRSVNRAAERIFGYPADAIVGCDLSRLVVRPSAAAGEADPWLRLLARLVEGRRPQELAGLRATGESFPMEFAVTEAPHEARRLYIALVRDISARKQAERLAMEAQRRLVEAIESISEGFVLWDPEDRLVLCNRKFRQMHSAVGDLLRPGRSFAEFARAYGDVARPPEADGRTQAWLEDRLARHANPGPPFQQRTADGRWLRISERRTEEGGVVGIAIDVTEERNAAEALRRAKEMAESASRAKSEFLANMSHELRTPLNAILGFSEIIKGELFGPIGNAQYTSYAADIYDSGRHLLEVISDILDLSRIEAGRLTLHEEEIDLQQVAQACLRLIAERADNARLTVTAQIAEDLPRLRADSRLVKQSIINLLSNAVKFTPECGTITLRALRETSGHVAIAIADTGIGIADGDIARALEPFGQVDSSVSRQYDGTGLGLPLVKAFLELHGGSILIQSTPGAGTTATIRFPPERVLPAPERAVASAGFGQRGAAPDVRSEVRPCDVRRDPPSDRRAPRLSVGPGE